MQCMAGVRFGTRGQPTFLGVVFVPYWAVQTASIPKPKLVAIILAILGLAVLLLPSPPRTVVFNVTIRSTCHRNINRAFSTAQDKQSQ